MLKFLRVTCLNNRASREVDTAGQLLLTMVPVVVMCSGKWPGAIVLNAMSGQYDSVALAEGVGSVSSKGGGCAYSRSLPSNRGDTRMRVEVFDALGP